MNEFLLTLAIGILVGVLGNFAYQWTRDLVARATGRIEIKGVWAERIVDGTERVHSIGQIRYDMRQQMWVFDGTNYHNDGTPFCHWRTISSYVDRKDHRYYYIFLNTHVDATHAGYTGFGFVDLEHRGGAWVPRNGAFAAGNPGEAFRSHSMVKLDEHPVTTEEVLEIFSRLSPSGSGS